MKPYYTAPGIVLHHGDALDVLRGMADQSVDAVCTDPPYNLSDSGKRDTDCLRRILSNVTLPNNDERDVEIRESVNLPRPPLGGPALGRVGSAVRVDAGVGVPEGAVDFKHPTITQREIGASNEPTTPAPDGNLPLVGDTDPVEYLGDYVLHAADTADATFCDATCSCFTEPFQSGVAVSVAFTSPTSGDSPLIALRGVRRGDTNIRHGDDAVSQPSGPALVMAGAGTVDTFMLRLDLTRGTGELTPAHGARALDPVAAVSETQSVRTLTGTGRLSPVLEPYRISFVFDATVRTFTLHVPGAIRHVVKSTATGGFMGRAWDGWQSPAAFQRWCTAWAAECLRVLKPGGHLLSFGGTRTYHRLACAVEDAGFEIRDSIASFGGTIPGPFGSLEWVQGQGFPKSLDVSKAIDKAAPRSDMFGPFAAYLRSRRQSSGLTQKDVARHFLSKAGGLTGCVWNWENGASVPTRDQWDALAPMLHLSDEWLPLIERIEAEREVVGSRPQRANSPTSSVPLNASVGSVEPLTLPATEAAAKWAGWGTALRPSHEPIVVARKPLGGNTVAANVLEHGTGGLNIDGCRVATTDDLNGGAYYGTLRSSGQTAAMWDSLNRGIGEFVQPAGRWPANVVLTHAATPEGGDACAGGCVDGCPVRELDAQSGVLTSGILAAHHARAPKEAGILGAYGSAEGERGYGDTGGASRFFPTFRYQAKAGTAERPYEVDGEGRRIAHPTCKPLSLIRFLVKLVTPPGGTVLDPFLGSGTTAEACIIEGFNCIGIEREAEYLPLIVQRLSKPIQPDLFGGAG